MADGGVATWGHDMDGCGGHTNGPIDNGYISIYSTECSFIAIKANGELYSWGSIEGFSNSYSIKLD